MEDTQNETEGQRTFDPALLAEATVPKGKKTKKYDPLESIPTAAIGTDITEGQSVSGIFVRTERLSSHKFTNSNERDENNVPVQYRHVLRLQSGKLMAIWNTGELKMVFGKLPVGTLITLKYKGKGKNPKGQQQHMFDYAIEETSDIQ